MDLDLLQGSTLPRPDYLGGGILNLMASLLRALGGESDHPSLRLLPPEGLEGFTNLLLLVIDGLGADWLARQAPTGLLSQHRIGTLSSVFPPTTASAITTFLTGEPPQRHAITGWFTYFRELGCVLSVLPGHPRYGGSGYRQAGVDLIQLLGHRPLANRIPIRTFVVSPQHIANSDYNLAHLGSARCQPYADLPDMFRQANRLLRADRDPKYLYLYWPGLDSLGHEAGMASQTLNRHLAAIEAALADFLVAAAGTRTLILVTADHGLIDTQPEDVIFLADHPRLESCLALPLCGEPRAAYCYLRPGRVADFESYCKDVFADRVLVKPSQELLAAGLFGPGPPHPRLEERIGDYTLFPLGNRLIRDHLPSEKPFKQIGVHGGLSREELMVPLCQLRTT